MPLAGSPTLDERDFLRGDPGLDQQLFGDGAGLDVVDRELDGERAAFAQRLPREVEPSVRRWGLLGLGDRGALVQFATAWKLRTAVSKPLAPGVATSSRSWMRGPGACEITAEPDPLRVTESAPSLITAPCIVPGE